MSTPLFRARGLDNPDGASKRTDLQRGKRADHDQLPDEIKQLYVENADILRKMRECHVRLRMITPETSTCPDSDRFPGLRKSSPSIRSTVRTGIATTIMSRVRPRLLCNSSRTHALTRAMLPVSFICSSANTPPIPMTRWLSAYAIRMPVLPRQPWLSVKK